MASHATSKQDTTKQDVTEAAKQSYIYTYPLMLTEITASLFTAVDSPNKTATPRSIRWAERKGR